MTPTPPRPVEPTPKANRQGEFERPKVHPRAGTPSTGNRDQVRVKGQVWHARSTKQRIPVTILFDMGAGGGSYVSMVFFHVLRRWGGVTRWLCKKGKGARSAAHPANSHIPPIPVRGTTVMQVGFGSE